MHKHGDDHNFKRMPSDCELVDPVVADPVARDKDKRNNIQMYTESPYWSTRREGTKLPNTHILSLSCRRTFLEQLS